MIVISELDLISGQDLDRSTHQVIWQSQEPEPIYQARCGFTASAVGVVSREVASWDDVDEGDRCGNCDYLERLERRRAGESEVKFFQMLDELDEIIVEGEAGILVIGDDAILGGRLGLGGDR